MSKVSKFLGEMDARGQETYAMLGNGALDVLTAYDRVNGLVKTITSGFYGTTGQQNLAYTWDRVGNLKSRTDHNQTGLTEAFDYDALNRLTDGSLNSTANLQMSYAANGNIEAKSGPAGYSTSYGYSASSKPHAVSSTSRSYPCAAGSCTDTDSYSYDGNGQMLQRATQAHGSQTAVPNRWVTWTAFGKPKQISVGAANCAADCTTFTYGPDRELVKQVVKSGGGTTTIYYVGPHFEVQVEVQVTGTSTIYRSHALANGQVVFTQIEESGGVGWQAYYPLRDHLGGVDKQYQAIGGGAQTLAYSYDAYGRRRNPDWSADPAGAQMTVTPWNHRGYTDHEMLDAVQLIHMKGRVYDPTLGRFLSPDPLLDDLNQPQSLNPYSYVANNPLSYTDPTGYRADDDKGGFDFGSGGFGGIGFGGISIVVNTNPCPSCNLQYSDFKRSYTGSYVGCGVGSSGRRSGCTVPFSVGRMGAGAYQYAMWDPIGLQSCGNSLVCRAQERITTHPVQGQSAINRRDQPGEGCGEFGTPRSGGRTHQGVDLQGDVGQPIVASGDGRVTRADGTDKNGYGNQVQIDHGDGVGTRSGHMDTINVKPGDEVKTGDQIGAMGRTGNTPAAGDTHVHFEVKVDGKTVDPVKVLPEIAKPPVCPRGALGVCP